MKKKAHPIGMLSFILHSDFCNLTFALGLDHASSIYLDYNATTPIDSLAVADAMQPYLHAQFGNPSSTHAYGRATHDAVDAARKQVASLRPCGRG
ncbi:MAG: aminotransferase class V-fold PLP-dependent enzyme [Gemmataceae bacterium]